MKQENKNVRAKVGVADRKKAIRKLIGKQRKIDIDYYQEQVGPDYRVVAIVDRGNELQAWLSMGAEYIPESRPDKAKGEQGAAREWCGTAENGTAEYQYYLSVPADLYDDIIAMKQEDAMRPVDILENRARGGQDNETGIGGVETYAPNLPSGGVGMS